MRLRYALAALLFAIPSILMITGSAWYLLDTESCVQHERLCMGAMGQLSVAETVSALGIGLCGLALGITLFSGASSKEEKRGLRGTALIGALLVLGGAGHLVLNITVLTGHNLGLPGPVPGGGITTLSMLALVLDLAMIGMGILILSWRKKTKASEKH